MTDLWHELKQAIAHPDLADLAHLWDELERLMPSLPEHEQLRVAAEAIAQIAEVYSVRAEAILSSLETGNQTPTEPVLGADFLAGLVQQASSLSLDRLVAAAPPERRQRAEKPSGSVAGSVDKQQLLAVLDQMNPLQLAYQENVGEWSEAIAQYLKQKGSQVNLLELQQSLNMPLVEVWLGLLLSGYHLEQRGDFYSPEIWVNEQLSR